MYEPAPQCLQPSAVAMRPGHEEAAAQILDLEAPFVELRARFKALLEKGSGGSQEDYDALKAENEELKNVVVVVTRYKAKDAPMLGAGGLLRAYGSAARLAVAVWEAGSTPAWRACWAA